MTIFDELQTVLELHDESTIGRGNLLPDLLELIERLLSHGSTPDLINEIEARTLKVKGAAAYLGSHPSYVRKLSNERLPYLTIFGIRVFTLQVLEEEHNRRQARLDRIVLNQLNAEILELEKSKGYGCRTVKQLRDACRERGLHVIGTKAELIASLEEDDENVCIS